MRPRHVNQRGKPVSKPISLYDKWLDQCGHWFADYRLDDGGFKFRDDFYQIFSSALSFFDSSNCYLFAGLMIALIVIRTDSSFWERISMPMLIVCLLMLLIVLIPGIGRTVNGSRRWLALGPIGIQVSELAKLTIIFYLSGYLVRQQKAVSERIVGFIKPMLILGFGFSIALTRT